MKKIFLLGVIFFASISLFSQVDEYEYPDNPPKDTTNKEHGKLYAGGYISGSIISPWGLYITPTLAYHVTDWFSTGISSDFLISKYPHYAAMIDYGAGAFSEFYLFNTIVFHSEVKYLNVYDYLAVKRVWNPAYYLGLGYKQNYGKKWYTTYLILWDFNQNANSVYRNPVLRFVFYFNL